MVNQPIWAAVYSTRLVVHINLKATLPFSFAPPAPRHGGFQQLLAPKMRRRGPPRGVGRVPRRELLQRGQRAAGGRKQQRSAGRGRFGLQPTFF